MAFTKFEWHNTSSGGTKLNETNLNNLEDRIETAINTEIAARSSAISTETTNRTTAISTEATNRTIADTLLKAYTDGKIRLSVKDFGAAGNGTTDDTAAIQAALTQAVANGGGMVYVPAGVYKITGQILVENKCGLIGDGQYTTEFACYSASAGIKFVRGATTRGGFSGSFKISMRSTSTLGFHAEQSVNRNFRDIRIDGPAEDGTCMQLDDCQNCAFFGTDLEAKGGSPGLPGTKGITFDKGASGNNFYGTRTNEFVDYHIGFRHTATGWSGVDMPRHNCFWGVMMERGIPGSTRIVYAKAGADNQFFSGNFSLGPGAGDPDATEEYPIVEIDNTSGDTGPGNPRSSRFMFSDLKINGDVVGGIRWAIAFKILGPYHYGTIRDCTIGNVRHFMSFDQYSHYWRDKDNFVDINATSRYKSPDGWARANFMSNSTPNPERSRINYFYVGGSGDLATIPGTVEVGYIIHIQFYASRTIKHGTGNIYTNTGADIVTSSGQTYQFVWNGTEWRQPK